MVKFVRFTKAQRERERVLKTRLNMAKRGISDSDGRTRVVAHKAIDKAQKDLKKLYDKVYGKK